MGTVTVIIVSVVIGLIAFLFGSKVKEQKQLNQAKIPPDVLQWRPEVFQASKEFGVPVQVVFPVLWTESAGNPSARGSNGEFGLMQLKEIAVNDLQLQGFGKFPGWKQDPRQNIRAGTAFLKLQFKRTGNWFEAIKAYNQGFKGAQTRPGLANEYLERVRAKQAFFT